MLAVERSGNYKTIIFHPTDEAEERDNGETLVLKVPQLKGYGKVVGVRQRFDSEEEMAKALNVTASGLDSLTLLMDEEY